VSRTKAREALLAFVFLLPALVILGVFVFYPLGRTIWLGLYRGGGFSGKKTYVGWHQYWDVFQSNEFRHSLGVTFVFALITVPIGIALGLGLAVLADKHLRGMRFFRTVYSSTVATSVAVASLIWLVLLQPQIGVLTNILPFSVLESRACCRTRRGLRPPSAWSPIWAAGFTFIIMTAGLQSIPAPSTRARPSTVPAGSSLHQRDRAAPRPDHLVRHRRAHDPARPDLRRDRSPHRRRAPRATTRRRSRT
jgi:ABC-type sugar transport system permease subunit